MPTIAHWMTKKLSWSLFEKFLPRMCGLVCVWVRSSLCSWMQCFWMMSSDQTCVCRVLSEWVVSQPHSMSNMHAEKVFVVRWGAHRSLGSFTYILHLFFMTCGWSRLIYIPIKDNCDGNFYRAPPTILCTFKLISNYYAEIQKLCGRSPDKSDGRVRLRVRRKPQSCSANCDANIILFSHVRWALKSSADIHRSVFAYLKCELWIMVLRWRRRCRHDANWMWCPTLVCTLHKPLDTQYWIYNLYGN